MSKKGGTATSRPAISPPLKWHRQGGKHYLASKLIALMPAHTHYVEPFAGGLAVLLAKDPEGVSEVVNDIDLLLTIFWRVLASEQHFPEFVRRVQATPFSEAEWNREVEGETWHGSDVKHVSAVESAVRFFVRCRQSMAGRMRDFATLSRNRVRRGMNEQVSAWLTAVEGLPAVHERLKRVVVLNRDALDVIRQQDGPNTFFYLDPPYLKETRTSPDVYAHEMTEQQHHSLLSLLATVKGRFMLSGYQCPLYAQFAVERGWHRVDFDLPNNAAGGGAKRRMTESVWMNYKPAMV